MPAEDRAELVRWTRAPSLRAGLAQRARIVLLAEEGVGTNEIVERVGVSKPTVIAWKKRYAAEGIAGLEDRPKPGRPAAGRRGRGGAGDAGAAAGAAGGDALVDAGCWPITSAIGRDLERVGRQDLAQVGPAAVAAGDVQVLHRPAAGGQGPRRRRAVPEPAGEGGGALDRREDPDPGPGPDRADPADAPGPAGEGHPRLRPARHHHPVRRLGDRHRQGHRRLLPAAPQRRVPALPQAGRQGLPAGEAAPGRATTTPPTSTPPSRPGWPATRGSPCTSPRPRARG